jgi:hypothetical protein
MFAEHLDLTEQFAHVKQGAKTLHFGAKRCSLDARNVSILVRIETFQNAKKSTF